ncbi:ABC transporter ATP-binding protein [Bacillus sp. 2205SS5-2]|uniref:ABC transporter ATP-binding protein n=1 Tax=Bacillus sp. 2205SS5-2 TaxID=3109031 RepID=UPI00300505FA
MITFKNVTKSFQEGTIAVKNLNLHIEKGELVALIGPSGCGKTTTMKMINKLLHPNEGSILIDGEDIAHVNDVELRRNIGYVIQRIGLLPHMTIEENIALIPKLKGWAKEKWKKRVKELLEMVDLDPNTYSHRFPLELSGGQQQRVGVIRALAAEPPVILMDEPFSALDPISREQLQDELKLIQEKIQKTIVFVTHDIDEALKIADRIAIMKDGVIQQIATPTELISNPKNEFITQFIGEHRLKKTPIHKSVSSLQILKTIPHSSVPSSVSIQEDESIQRAASLILTEDIPFLPVKRKEDTLGYITKEILLREFADLEKEGVRG